MLTLFHQPLCPHSRYVRLILGEYGIAARLVEERFWERREEFLLLNPAAELPVLVAEGEPPIPGAGIVAEYIEETHQAESGEDRLLPPQPGRRVEVRRLANWFNDKFHAEVSGPLVNERVFKRHMTQEQGGGPPDTEALRAARHNIRYHLAYIGWLVQTRDWLTGNRLTLADLAAAAHLSAVDYLGEVPWNDRRSDKELVRAGEVPSVVQDDPRRHAGRSSAVENLRRPRLLKDPAAIKAALAERARAAGFDAFGVVKPDAAPELKSRLERFLADGAHGDMTWLESTAERRASPLVLWPDMRSIIMLGMNYGPDDDPLAILKEHDHAAISVYAQGDDYHDLIKARLKELARWLTANAGGDVKVFVDTAAVMEKPLAARGGLGWQGKHTNVVSREFTGRGCFSARFSRRSIFPRTPRNRDNCGTCRACLDVCPTAAFPAPYQLDPRRCISYLTIEHKGPIARDLRAAMGIEFTAAMIVSRCARGTSSPAAAERPSLRRVILCVRHVWQISPAWTMRNSERCLPRRRSNAPAAIALSGMC